MTRAGNLCEVCGVGTVVLEVYDHTVGWRGRKGNIVMQTKVCDHCKGEYGDVFTTALNKQAMLQFRERIDSELGIKE